jgi:hypothetical protein
MYIIGVFKVNFKRRIEKAVEKMPKDQAAKFYALVNDLRLHGPVRANWPNYSMLKGTNTHHCHLSRKWAACWAETKKGIEIEVIYAGSRESAPYA